MTVDVARPMERGTIGAIFPGTALGECGKVETLLRIGVFIADERWMFWSLVTALISHLTCPLYSVLQNLEVRAIARPPPYEPRLNLAHEYTLHWPISPVLQTSSSARVWAAKPPRRKRFVCVDRLADGGGRRRFLAGRVLPLGPGLL